MPVIPVDPTTQDDCVAGQYWDGNACTACVAGSTSDDKSNVCTCAEGIWNSATNQCDTVETIDDCVAGQYWDGTACTTCAAGSTSEDKSSVCTCTEGTWNSTTNQCDAVEKVSEKVAACLGGVWNEVSGKCTCPDGMSLIGGVCIAPISDEFQTGGTNEADKVLDDSNQMGLVAEVGAIAENSGTITGTSDTGLTGIRVAGVSEDATVSGEELTKESQIDLSKASQGINTDTGKIELSHATTNGQSLYGIHATTGATVSNAGEIVITSKSKQTSYGVFIDGAGHSFDNQGNITLNVGGQTEKIYGIAADDRNVSNSATIDVILASDLEDVGDTKSAIAGMQGGTLANKGTINFNSSALTNKVGINFAGLSLAPFGTAINEAGGKINLNVSNIVGRISGLQTVDGAMTGNLVNKGEINITGSLYRDDQGSSSIFGMYQQNGKLENSGKMTAKLDTTLGGQMFFMRNITGEIINETDGEMKIDLSQTADSVRSAEIAALSTSTGNLTNKGKIVINADLNGFQSDGSITAMNAEGKSTVTNENLIQITSNADNVSLYGMTGKEGQLLNKGTLKIETTGQNVSLDSVSGHGGSAQNSGKIILNHFGSGSVDGASGGNDGEVIINTKDGVFSSITGFASIGGSGAQVEKDASVNINLFGNTVANEVKYNIAGNTVYRTDFGIIGFRSTGTTSNAGTVNIRTNDGYISEEDVKSIYGDSSYRRSGEDFGYMFGMYQTIDLTKKDSRYNGNSITNGGLINIQADGTNSKIYGMASLKGIYHIFDSEMSENDRYALLHGQLDPLSVSSVILPRTVGEDAGDRLMVNNGTLNIETKTNTSIIGMLAAQDRWEKEQPKTDTGTGTGGSGTGTGDNTGDGDGTGDEPETPEPPKPEYIYEKSRMENTGHITITALGNTDNGMIVSFDTTPAFIPYSVIGMATNSKIVDEKTGKITTYGATNSGGINIQVTGDTRAAGMVAYGNGAALNKGTIEISHKDGKNDTTSAYAQQWGPQLVGCYAANGGICHNEGTIRINGSVDNYSIFNKAEDDDAVYVETNAKQFLLTAGKATYAVSDKGLVDAKGFQIIGQALVDTAAVQGSHKTQYVLSGQGEGAFIGNGDNSALSAISGSALFDATLVQNDLNENGVNIQMTMKPFDELVNNKSLANFLTTNYANERNGAFFDEIKSIGSATAFHSALNNLTGADTIARFTNEDLSTMRQVNQSMNHMMFANNDKNTFETRGSLNHFGFKNDDNSSAQYVLANKRISSRFKIGYAMSQTTMRTDDGDNASRRNNIFQVFMPVGYEKSGWQMIATPQLGYSRAHYSRSDLNQSNYDGVIEKRMFALMNEARYPIAVGAFEIAPTVELNAIAYNQKGKEDQSAYALIMPSDNNLSVEAGLGLHATRQVGSLNLTAGLMFYKEFADPYNIKMGMNGMDGTFNLYDDVSDYRGTASFGFNYNVGQTNMYGLVQHFMENDTHTNIKAGVRFAF